MIQEPVGKKRQDELHFTTQIWGESEGVEARLRELMNEVRALRKEMADERDSPLLGGERQLPKHDREPGSPPSARRRPR